jgi:hypothetical protein
MQDPPLKWREILGCVLYGFAIFVTVTFGYMLLIDFAGALSRKVETDGYSSAIWTASANETVALARDRVQAYLSYCDVIVQTTACLIGAPASRLDEKDEIAREYQAKLDDLRCKHAKDVETVDEWLRSELDAFYGRDEIADEMPHCFKAYTYIKQQERPKFFCSGFSNDGLSLSQCCLCQ